MVLLARSRSVDGPFLDEAVLQARDLESSWVDLRDGELSEQMRQLEERELQSPESTETLAAGAGLGAESIRRQLGFRLHDVQVRGAIAAAVGAIIEMQTGEGKTVVCGLAAIIRAILDASVHVATTNDYLAERDYQVVRPVFEQLGISSGLLLPKSTPSESRAAYRCRITYGPGYQFGFDYLRDQLTLRRDEEDALGREVLSAINGRSVEDQLVQTSFSSVIIDEADSVLLDEAATPLILSGGVESADFTATASQAYLVARRMAKSLEEGRDYVVDRQRRSVELTDEGFRLVHDLLADHGPLELSQPWQLYIQNALTATQLYQRDQQYVVQEDKIKLVDAFTGRIFDDRTLRNGLHQALEAKEDVAINPPSRSLARVTRQRFFQQYATICGMTGTAAGSEAELSHFYAVDVVNLNPHRPCRRKELPDRFFDSWDSKLNAITLDVAVRHKQGRPVLIGTSTIRESQRVEQALKAAGLDVVVLNGIQDAAEADIVSLAGREGAITVATNMAGRGTDIKLTDHARDCGGLHVIGTQRHTSRRVDRQLAGRAARQGDPGSAQFFISAEDDLLETHGVSLANQIIASADLQGESKIKLSTQIQRLQEQIEDRQFHMRRALVQHDNWLDAVRETMSHEHETSS